MAAPIKTPRPPRKYTPEYMRDGYVGEATRQAQRRMAPHLKPIDAMLILWAPEARFDGAPQNFLDPKGGTATLLSRVIELGSNGASHSGGRVQLPREFHIEFADWAVSLMPELNRRVIFTEYVHCPAWPAERKARAIDMPIGTWAAALHEGRTVVWTLLRGFGFSV